MAFMGGGPAGASGGTMGKPQQVGGKNLLSASTLTPEQQDLFSRLMQGSTAGSEAGLGYLSQLAGGGTPEFWEQNEAPAMRQFGQFQGAQASRFSGAGSLGARKSSGFQNTLGGASADFAAQLQSQRQGLQKSAIDQLLGISKDLLGRDTQHQWLQEPKKPWWQQALGIGLPIAGAAAGAFGGPAGMALGSNIGSQLGGAFSGGQQGNYDYSGIGGLSNKWGA